jgi:DNA-directed RNA polymerase specialized sigma24 family protein
VAPRLPEALPLEGCSHQEAGEILGMSAKTIEMRACRARGILAQTLESISPPAQ